MSVLRVATQNLWGARAPLEDRMRAIADKMSALSVDVLALQEVAPLANSTSAHFIAALLGGRVVLTQRARPGFALAVVLFQNPLKVVEEALVSARAGEPRRRLSVQLRRDVWIHVAHLDYRRSDGLWREQQVLALQRAVAEQPEALHILCGDMNADPSSDEMRFLRGETTLAAQRTFFQDAWIRHHPGQPGWTWSQESGPSRAERTIDVDRRIDYIYVGERRKDGRGTILSCSRVLWSEESGPLASDHASVIAEIQLGASQSA